jgi:hypothetical protein
MGSPIVRENDTPKEPEKTLEQCRAELAILVLWSESLRAQIEKVDNQIRHCRADIKIRERTDQ